MRNETTDAAFHEGMAKKDWTEETLLTGLDNLGFLCFPKDIRRMPIYFYLSKTIIPYCYYKKNIEYFVFYLVLIMYLLLLNFLHIYFNIVVIIFY